MSWALPHTLLYTGQIISTGPYTHMHMVGQRPHCSHTRHATLMLHRLPRTQGKPRRAMPSSSLHRAHKAMGGKKVREVCAHPEQSECLPLPSNRTGRHSGASKGGAQTPLLPTATYCFTECHTQNNATTTRTKTPPTNKNTITNDTPPRAHAPCALPHQARLGEHMRNWRTRAT